MSHHPHPTKSGFTIIEVSLVLSISAFLIIGIMVGTGATIARQRYNDSVQNFAEFLRRQYSDVINTQINHRTLNTATEQPNPTICGILTGTMDDAVHRGRSTCVIYGKLIVIGRNLTTADAKNTVDVFDVVGLDTNTAYKNSAGYVDVPATETLENSFKKVRLSIDNISITKAGFNYSCAYAPQNGYTSYRLQWDATPQTTASADNDLRAFVLIVRSPLTSTVSTYTWSLNTASPPPGTTNLTSHIITDSTALTCPSATATQNGMSIHHYFASGITSNNFTTTDLDICVGSPDVFASTSRRRMIKIIGGGRNASAVNIIDQDTGENACS